MSDQTDATPVADPDAEATQTPVAAAAAETAQTDAAAEVTAAAEPTADAPAEAEAKPAKKAKAKRVETDRLQGLIALIENRNVGGLREELIDELKADEGAKISDKDSTYSIDLAGISTSCTAGWGLMLANWCNKARRALLGAEG